MIKTLFVYGSLMQDTGSPMARFLHARASLLGTAYLSGRLYDLGSYPGAVFDARAEHVVTGQVYQLDRPKAIFPELDRYEGVSNNPPVEEEYIRALVPVQLDGQTIQCWCYLYNFDPQPLSLIPSGDYLSYYANRLAHRAFIRGGR